MHTFWVSMVNGQKKKGEKIDWKIDMFYLCCGGWSSSSSTSLSEHHQYEHKTNSPRVSLHHRRDDSMREKLIKKLCQPSEDMRVFGSSVVRFTAQYLCIKLCIQNLYSLFNISNNSQWKFSRISHKHWFYYEPEF